jgi:O-acetyl-ADP-ribose deacetylase (regulator of RNase III)
MIERGTGNLLQAYVEALVNTVNCVGVMGKGIALQFKQAFPDNFNEYKRACDARQIKLGEVFVIKMGKGVTPAYIINFPTKYHWKGKSRLEDIKSGLQSLVTNVRLLGIESIAVPPLGCGNGGLDWTEVKPLIEKAFAELPNVHILLFEPGSAPEADQMPVATKTPKMSRARALLIRLLERYREAGDASTLLEVQKLLYFLQSAGEPLKLQYSRNQYGPYAEAVNFILQKMNGHFIHGYSDRNTRSTIYLVPSAIEPARASLANEVEAQEHLARVSRLIEGFETPYGMELLATVHWLAHEDHRTAVDVEIAIEQVRNWSTRKAELFKPEHIRKAWERLRDQGWFDNIQSTIKLRDLIDWYPQR